MVWSMKKLVPQGWPLNFSVTNNRQIITEPQKWIEREVFPWRSSTCLVQACWDKGKKKECKHRFSIVVSGWPAASEGSSTVDRLQCSGPDRVQKLEPQTGTTLEGLPHTKQGRCGKGKGENKSYPLVTQDVGKMMRSRTGHSPIKLEPC